MSPSIDGDFSPHRQPTSVSSFRMPTPPRIAIPPPKLNRNYLPEIHLHPLPSASFLNDVDYTEFTKKSALTRDWWMYERRREAQMIFPYIYLGPMTAAKDTAWLEKEGITCMLGVRYRPLSKTKSADSKFHSANQLGIEFNSIDIANNQDLIQALPDITKYIIEHLKSSKERTGELGKVLVFCETGNERSAGVVAACLMELHEDVDHVKAMQICQIQRTCVAFDDAMKRLLQSYWDIIAARRAVEAQNDMASSESVDQFSFAPDFSVSKRKAESDVDDDTETEASAMETDSESDAVRFERRGVAPFFE